MKETKNFMENTGRFTQNCASKAQRVNKEGGKTLAKVVGQELVHRVISRLILSRTLTVQLGSLYFCLLLPSLK